MPALSSRIGQRQAIVKALRPESGIQRKSGPCRVVNTSQTDRIITLTYYSIFILKTDFWETCFMKNIPAMIKYGICAMILGLAPALIAAPASAGAFAGGAS
jgi:hypothetical protein